MNDINAKSNTYPFFEVVLYSEIVRSICRVNQSRFSHQINIISGIKVIKVTPRMSNGMYSSRQIVTYIARPESRIDRTVMMEIIRTSHGKDTISLNASDAAKDCVKMQTARRGIRRYKPGMIPPEPATCRYLVFVGPWTTTGGDDPKPFLSHDSGQNVRDRVIVIATD